MNIFFEILISPFKTHGNLIFFVIGKILVLLYLNQQSDHDLKVQDVKCI